MTEPDNFKSLVDQAMKDPALGHIRPVIEKELLHYDLLYALDKEKMLDNLVFQGGTCLRLCYGGSRFSEDLDFAGGVSFTSQKLADMKTCIEDYLSKRYELEVTVKEPASLRSDPKYAELKIDKWQIRVVTSPDRRDLPKQMIKFEVANIPAHTRVAQPLVRNYDFLPDGYEDLLVMAETRDEIMVDYRLDSYLDRLDNMIPRLPEIVAGKNFQDEMARFLPADVHERTLGQDKFQSYLTTTLTDLLTTVQTELSHDQSEKPSFHM